MPLQGKKIILAITGSIAAYKSAYLCRQLVRQGVEVKVIMTPAATKFISPLTFSTLSKNPVYTDVIDGNSWNDHVSLGLWADLMLVAPATANTISKMAHGTCDNIITAVYLSAKCPVFIAPAMDRDMWLHPTTQENIKRLASFGNTLIDVEEGELASGLTGPGRMAEPDHILDKLSFFFASREDLKGRQVMITAGPTHEAIDPVRYIGNKSTGTMGISLAKACADRGAQVDLILGPVQNRPTHGGIRVHLVRSAREMYEQALALHDRCDVAIFAAAVADYRPRNEHNRKIKKEDGDMTLELERTHDIAASLGQRKKSHQIHVGFSLETDNEEANAQGKLSSKNFDLIVLNSLQDEGAGFGESTNKVTIYTSQGEKIPFTLKTKTEVAEDIVNILVKRYLES